MEEDKQLTPQPKIDPVGLKTFGEAFTRYHKLEDIKDLIPAFKDYYYQEKFKDPNTTLSEILRGFNKNVCKPVDRTFYPYGSLVRKWRKVWDLDLLQKFRKKDIEMTSEKDIHQIIKTRDDERNLVLGLADDNQLEAGVRTLGGELLNDAMQMLRDDQALEEIYDNETLVKRRNYIVNVFAHTTRLVHGKAALMLKASEEKRSNAGFLMSLLARASAGKMSDDEMELLKGAYAPKQHAGEPV